MRARWAARALSSRSYRPRTTLRNSRCFAEAPSPTSGSALPELGGGPLAKVLRDSMKATGPIPVSTYMQWCLSHPVHGYYTQGDVFGKQGDFITSPEISQIFGELLAVWFVTRYIAAGHPERCRLVELGPGRGTLMADMIRTFGQLRGVASSLKSIHLVENSEKMRKIQEDKLGEMCKQRGIEIHWTDRLEDVSASEDFTMVMAHEFFDAMPINVFEKTQDGFREVMVDLDREAVSSSSKPSSGLRLTISREPSTSSQLLPVTSPRFAALPLGARVEIAHDSWKIARKLGELIDPLNEAGPSSVGSVESEAGAADRKGKKARGAGLIVDYGGDTSYGHSFRAIKQHKIVDVFDTPGSADLTANVDFAYLREAVSGTGTRTLGPISQAQFLLSLGLQPRLQKLLATNPSPERKEDLTKAARRLIDPLQMGSQYQIMGLSGAVGNEEIYPFPLDQAGETSVGELRSTAETKAAETKSET